MEEVEVEAVEVEGAGQHRDPQALGQALQTRPTPRWHLVATTSW